MRLVDLARVRIAPVVANAIGPLIARGAVRVDGRVGMIDDEVAPDATLALDRSLVDDVDWIEPEPSSLVIAHEDANLLVVDKPAGMHVHPLGPHRTGTLLNALLHHAGARADQPVAAYRPHPVHRLDRPVSGLLLVSKSATHPPCDRRYEATVHGHLDSGTLDAPLGRDPALDYRRAVRSDGQSAITHYDVLSRTADTTTLSVRLDTGRTHQIRAHFAHLGHPIVGDALYGSTVATPPGIALRAVTLTVGDLVVRTAPCRRS